MLGDWAQAYTLGLMELGFFSEGSWDAAIKLAQQGLLNFTPLKLLLPLNFTTAL